MPFIEREPSMLGENPFRLIGTDWMLITAGTRERYNTMTASWGGLGVLWERAVCFIFVRPTRYTFEFLERADAFSLSFFAERHRAALTYCGTHSGRDTDKARGAGLTPVEEAGIICFTEARLVMACRKIYHQDLAPDRFLDPAIGTLYPKKDYHRMYVGEIRTCLVSEG